MLFGCALKNSQPVKLKIYQIQVRQDFRDPSKIETSKQNGPPDKQPHLVFNEAK